MYRTSAEAIRVKGMPPVQGPEILCVIPLLCAVLICRQLLSSVLGEHGKRDPGLCLRVTLEGGAQ